jgi:DNA-binding NtrC family response regulator
MVRKFIYIRSRNQITLPSELVSHLQVGEGDYLQVEIGSSGKAQLAPARLAVVGSAEAAAQDAQAEEQIKSTEFRTLHDVESFTHSIGKSQPQVVQAESDTEGPASLDELERELIAATLRATNWNRSAAAKRLGWNASRFNGRLKKFNLTPEPTK